MRKKRSKWIKIAGLDPSLSNWGICKGSLDVFSGELIVDSVHLIHPNKYKGKKMRQNSKDVLAAQDLYKTSMQLLSDTDILCAELPTGSQSARASAGYGICIGVVGALNTELTEVVQVTPMQVKKVVGNDNPSKEDMIDWALDMHPEISFPTYKRNGLHYVSAAQAEHMADALAAIYAAAKTDHFLNLVEQYKELS